MKKRLYAPYIKVNGKWVRVDGKSAFTKQTAIRVYQNWLLEPYFGAVNETRELRPIKAGN